MHELNNMWTFWIHMPHDIDWSLNSYKKVYSFSKLEECIIFIENIDSEIIQKCMLFVMKDNIKPIWEDSKNNKGGSFSYKIDTELVNDVWKKIIYYLVGRTLIDDEILLDNINGVSISPKKNFCIIKLWVADINNLKNNDIYNYIINSQETDMERETEEDKYNNDPFNLEKLCNIEKHNCIFKLHNVLY